MYLAKASLDMVLTSLLMVMVLEAYLATQKGGLRGGGVLTCVRETYFLMLGLAYSLPLMVNLSLSVNFFHFQGAGITPSKIHPLHW